MNPTNAEFANNETDNTDMPMDAETLAAVFGSDFVQPQIPATEKKLFGIYLLQSLGDLIATSQIAKQIKHTHPNSHVVWFVLKKFQFVLRGNPYIDEFVELEGNNKEWDARIDELKQSRNWTEFYVPQPHLSYNYFPGGDLTELVKAAIGLEWTVPYVPVLRLDEQEISNAREYFRTLPAGMKIMVETEFQSEQSPWNVDYAKRMIESLRRHNPVFVFSAKNRPPYFDELQALYPRVEWCTLPYRENAELYNLCDAFIGVSSGISCLCQSDYCRTDVPHVELVLGTHWSTFHYKNHTKRRICFDERTFDGSLAWLNDVLDKKITGTEHPQTERIDLYKLGTEGKYTYISKTMLPHTYAKVEDMRSMRGALECLPPFYLHIDSLSDAILTLSVALDGEQDITVVSCCKNFNEVKPFFDAHDKIKHVYVIEYPETRPDAVQLLQLQMLELQNCMGTGLKLTAPEYRDATMMQRIQQLSVLSYYPTWIQRSKQKNPTPNIVVIPVANDAREFRSERNIIHPRYWKLLMEYVQINNLPVTVLGKPEEEKAYPLTQGCKNKRGISHLEEFEILANADVVVTCNAWYAHVAAMFGIPVIRFTSVVGHDLAFYRDDFMHSITQGWKNLLTVHNANEACSVLATMVKQTTGYTTSAPLPAPVHELNRRTNPQHMFTSLHPVFWERDYANASSILIRCSTALGDALMTTNVVRVLKQAYPHLRIIVSGNAVTEMVFRHNTDVECVVPRNSVDELAIEQTVDDTIEYNYIIDQLPDYYNGLHFMDIIGNVAGVKLQNKDLHYTITDTEKLFAQKAMHQVLDMSSKPFVVGLQLYTDKDEARSYQHVSALCEYLNHHIKNVRIVNFGTNAIQKTVEGMFDLPRYGVGLREQIAIADECHAFITIDSAFYHVAHNLLRKPTLLIQSVTNEALIGNPQLGTVRPMRNKEKGCMPCYWDKNACKGKCLIALHPQLVAQEFLAMMQDAMSGKPLWQPAYNHQTVARYDSMQREYAQSVYQQRSSGKTQRVVIAEHTEPLPPYAEQWNGVDVQRKQQSPASNLQADVRSVLRSAGVQQAFQSQH